MSIRRVTFPKAAPLPPPGKVSIIIGIKDANGNRAELAIPAVDATVAWAAFNSVMRNPHDKA